MSWFSGSSVQISDLDDKIAEATSESIPNGEIDIAVALEITDLIRSKKVPPRQCMRALKKRLTLVQANPNLTKSTLSLVDLCIKNGGYHFLVEIASKEFVDYLVDNVFRIHYNVRDRAVSGNPAKYDVGCYLFQLLKNWSAYFHGQLQLGTVEKAYKQLLHEGYDEAAILSAAAAGAPGGGPDLDLEGPAGFEFIDTEVPPDWVDGDECMICYNAFSVLNRKHHCRSCGGVYCQTHSSRSIPLVGLGLMEPVRVCDNCYEKKKGRLSATATGSSTSRGLDRSGSGRRSRHHDSGPVAAADDEEDDDLKRAIELSLRESQVPISRPNYPPPQAEYSAPPQAPEPAAGGNDEDEEQDEDMKAAIAASLREFKEKEKLYQQQSAPPPAVGEPEAPEEDFYNDLLPSHEPDHHSASNPFQRAPQQLPQQQQQQQQQPYQQQQQQQQPQKAPPPEDLTQQEEESVNLFITLMNNVKNDPAKQANILYDNNLSELHSNIIRFKPKLNRSLRASLEKYESFLELSNKISTITRLYDSFLENKLAQAYGGHSLGGVDNQYPPQQNTGYSNAPYPEQIGYPPQQQQHQAPSQPQPQHSGYGHASQIPSYPQSHPPSDYSQESVAQPQGHPQAQRRQSTGYPQPQTTGGYPPQQQQQQPQQQRTGQATGSYPGSQIPQPPQQQQQQQQHAQTTGAYPGSKPQQKSPQQQHLQAYPGAEPPQTSFKGQASYPPDLEPSYSYESQGENGYDQEQKRQSFVSGNESLRPDAAQGPYPSVDYYKQDSSSSQFYPSAPPGEDEAPSEPSQGPGYPSRISSTEPEDENEVKVAEKYPEVADFEESTKAETEGQKHEHGVTDLPSISNLPSLERSKSSQSEKIYAEEPLIEL